MNAETFSCMFYTDMPSTVSSASLMIVISLDHSSRYVPFTSPPVYSCFHRNDLFADMQSCLCLHILTRLSKLLFITFDAHENTYADVRMPDFAQLADIVVCGAALVSTYHGPLRQSMKWPCATTIIFHHYFIKPILMFLFCICTT